ncbi:hypothetical protein C7S18_18080 [Ahniella affigens]|uniref:Methyltransferase type 11 domain-containing protein n=1 Tax=Ahniella affigens TaxID=2021234 RepID=A0A2P1PVT6_9GAMM|nr:hypothetical protein C7S18_18080 [Ahniella affigens]
MWYEHWHRYAFALPVLAGKRVLDCACGEGYGSAMLATRAAEVDGVDLSAEAILHAKARYGAAPNLRFHQGNALELPFADHQFDAVVSFETLEHLVEQEQLLAGFRRVLKPDGFLLISSPDKRVYSDLTGYQNEFHLKELYRDELIDLLQRFFPATRVFGQKLMFQSTIVAEDGHFERATVAFGEAGSSAVTEAFALDPVYFIVACAARADALPALPGLHGFSDQSESVYRHYEHEIRKNMQAGQMLIDRDERIAKLEAELDVTKRALADAANATASVSGNTPAALPFWRRWFR